MKNYLIIFCILSILLFHYLSNTEWTDYDSIIFSIWAILATSKLLLLFIGLIILIKNCVSLEVTYELRYSKRQLSLIFFKIYF